jgi:hypothetical protein
MTLASPWLLAAMSEGGVPSARRVVMVVGLLLFAPLLLVIAARWVPAAFEWCLVAYMGICGGVYVVPAFAAKPPVSPVEPAGPSAVWVPCVTPPVAP